MDDELITATQAATRFGVPAWAIWRLVQRELLVPVEDEQKPWQKRPKRRYRLSDVARALGLEPR